MTGIADDKPVSRSQIKRVAVQQGMSLDHATKLAEEACPREQPEEQSKDSNYYHPGGVPITPQARRFGFEMPVYVSNTVWKECCVWTTAHGQTDSRIFQLLQACFEGLGKALAVSDDFLVFYFKHWYDDRARPKATKQKKLRLGARLLLDPEWDSPWLYIFDPDRDSIEALKRGENSEQEEILGERDGSASNDDES